MSTLDSSLLQLTSPLGDDRLPLQQGTLHAVAMTTVERLSAPFDISLTAVSTDRAVDPDEILNKPVTVTVRRKDGTDREFNGVVCKVESIGTEERRRWRYRLTVVPKLWFLDQSIDCRIFQQQTAEQILQTLFSEHQVEPVEFRLYGNKPMRPYTTQFNESDLIFVQRIMQESGYYYFFEHANSKHKLIVTDRNQAFKAQPSPVHRVMVHGNNVDILDTWREATGTAYGRVQTQDYDPEKPEKPVNGQEKTRLHTAGAASRDVYHWPAMTTDNSVAADRARFRMEAAEARASLRSAHGYDPNICPGFRFTLEKDPVTQGSDVEHVVHAVTHNAVDETWIGGTSPPRFDCAFSCFKQTTIWRDDLSIARPIMPGVFSGTVLGLPGEEIHSDELARIKVQPKFDYRKDTTADKSIFVRVLHAWSGNGWGWQHLPRVGTEVGIAFMNGDPDNPVVVGCFYHQENPPIFSVPAEENKQGFRSRSTIGGSTEEYNELSFDDTRGGERVYMLAHKNMKIESKIGSITMTADLLTVHIHGEAQVKLTAGAEIPDIGQTATNIQPNITMTPIGIEIGAPQIDLTAITNINLKAPTITMEAEEISLLTPLLMAPPPIPPVE